MTNIDKFKFRAWDKAHKEIYYPDVLVRKLNIGKDFRVMKPARMIGQEVVGCSDNILMQSSGLRDKNNKLIFEGDIVKTNNGLLGVICDSYRVCGLCIKILDVETALRSEFISTDNFIFSEVIGNIYENPEFD